MSVHAFVDDVVRTQKSNVVLGGREDVPMRPGRFYCLWCEPEADLSFGWLGEGHLGMRFWDQASPQLSRREVHPMIDGMAGNRVYEIMTGRRGWMIRRARDENGRFATCPNCGRDRLREIVYGHVSVVVTAEAV